MSTYFPSHKSTQRLNSPLLNIAYNNRIEKSNENTNKGKRTYYNPQEENKQPESIEKTLDTIIFNNKEKLLMSGEVNLINQKLIDSLETSFKLAGIFILAIGGILSLLEFINIVRTLYYGSFDFGNSLIIFACAFIGTILANIICNGFIHLIKTTKYIYLFIENQKAKI